jgi:Flp pilus assembly protein TadD
VDPALVDHPQHAPLHALRGQALIALGRSAEALESLRESIRLNPFDPSPHCELARASQDPAELSREQATCAQLHGPR